MRLKLICAALLVGLMVVMAGCGGSDEKAESTATTAATTAATTTEDDNSGDDNGSASGQIDLTSTDCAKLSAIGATIGQALSGTVPEGLDEDISRLEELAEGAPDEIKDDLVVMAQASAELAKVEIDPSKPLTAEQLGALLSKIDVQAVTAAGQNISAWAQANCTG